LKFLHIMDTIDNKDEECEIIRPASPLTSPLYVAPTPTPSPTPYPSQIVSREPIAATEPLPSIEKWDEFETLNPQVLRGIYNYGFEQPSQIQKTAILPILQGRDVIGQAPSGTGKTGAFTIGALNHVDVTQNTTQIMILAPTHELVKQITTVVRSIGNCMEGLVVKTVVGGTSILEDVASLRNVVPHVVVGSVGRVFDMIRRKHLRVHNLKLFIMDEADEMLSRGFKDQIYKIFQYLKSDVKVALFSATLPDEILQMSTHFMQNPVKITVEAEKLNLEGIQQYYVALTNDAAKFDTLKDIFGFLTVNQCIIYVNSVNRVVDLYEAMVKDGFSVCSIHSSMPADQRERAFTEFRTGTYRVLISSNVTSRGIDIQQVSTVINFDVPKCVNTYLHRIGRSGRWGRKGLAINFITRQDVGTMKNIERHYKSTIEELPANFTELANR